MTETKQNQNQDNELQKFEKLQERIQQEKIKRMIKYSFELKKVGLIDSLRQNIASELTNDEEINKEIKLIHGLLAHYLEKKEIDEYLKTNFTDYKDYRNNLLNTNLFDTLETKLKTGEIPINKLREIMERYQKTN